MEQMPDCFFFNERNHLIKHIHCLKLIFNDRVPLCICTKVNSLPKKFGPITALFVQKLAGIIIVIVALIVLIAMGICKGIEGSANNKISDIAIIDSNYYFISHPTSLTVT